jgi:hypothetical protein
VTRDYGRLLRSQFPFNYVEIGTADTAEGDANQDFPVCWLGNGIILNYQRVGFDPSRRVQDAGFHGRGTHPGCFGQRAWKLLRLKEMSFFGRQKSLQE